MTKINSVINFSGNLYLKKPKLWTDNMKKAVSENESIQTALKNNDITGNISTSKERKSPPYTSKHLKGDTLYKVSFTVTPDNLSPFQKLINKGKKYIINRHYHSEDTIVNRINNSQL